MTIGAAQQFFLGASKATGGGAAGYQIERSLRFNSNDSGFCSRTPAVAGNRTVYTWSFWLKRSGLGEYHVFRATSDSSNYTEVYFSSNDKLNFQNVSGGSANTRFVTTQVFRDTSAWYHLVLSINGSTAAKLYVNGVEVTVFDTTVGPGSSNHQINNTVSHTIGSSASSSYANFYLADVHFIDGQALTPSSFTEVSATTGQLIPKTYSGTFGTNGFWLKFSDNSALTSGSNAGVGKDYSGLGNYWNTFGLSVTAGAGNDSLVDTPTSYGTDTYVGGEVRGNYCTLNPLDLADFTLSNGNLNYSKTSTTWKSVRATIGVNSGKWYYEFQFGSDSRHYIGISQSSLAIANYPGATATSYAIYLFNGYKSNNGADSSYASAFTSSDVLGVAFDLDAATITFYKNGTSLGTAFTGIASGYYFPTFGTYLSGESGTVNFGQRAFAYTPPANFKPLVDTNLTAPVIAKPDQFFQTVLWTGSNTATARTISGLQFSPDLVWAKSRSLAYSHNFYDTVRGTGKGLYSDSTGAESTNNIYGYISAFNSDGFTGTPGSTDNGFFNQTNATYAAWCWDAGSSTVTNTQGSITSSVRANASSGFSVVTWTGNGSAGATIGHSLGVAPRFVIFKARSISENWNSYHASLGASQLIALNTTNAASSTNDFNNTAPTSSVITLGSGTGNNGNGTTYVAYCFAPVVGYGNGLSYVGNGSTDGPFCYLGFLPKLILIKCSSTTGNWVLLDTEREGYNVDNDPLFPNLSDAEATTDLLDITSNGFKIRSTNADVNASAATYIVYAWASNPFQYSRAR